MPISRVRSVTDTSIVFMMPMPPTTSEMPAMLPSRKDCVARDAVGRIERVLLTLHLEIVLGDLVTLAQQLRRRCPQPASMNSGLVVCTLIVLTNVPVATTEANERTSDIVVIGTEHAVVEIAELAVPPRVLITPTTVKMLPRAPLVDADGLADGVIATEQRLCDVGTEYHHQCIALHLFIGEEVAAAERRAAHDRVRGIRADRLRREVAGAGHDDLHRHVLLHADRGHELGAAGAARATASS